MSDEASTIKGWLRLLRKDMNTCFQWMTGLLLASWICVIGTLLVK